MKPILSPERIREIAENTTIRICNSRTASLSVQTEFAEKAIKQALSEQLDALIKRAEKDVDTDKPFAVHAWEWLKQIRESHEP